ncbi:hypothetical protein CN397_06660 [Priestia megaterium]|uniref:hypothetical protein n=1 Tax=Priestia megaterium TaxID=1404 RepID=UPI000BF5EAB4|nr:hypothetical protein [Priestia megaterium]PEU72554.1 hypothetical protein CN397_06660 [Priestia megaterium]
MYRKKTLLLKKSLGVAVFLSVIALGVWMFQFTFLSPSHQAKSAVKEFYTLEQEGNFSESWDLFHSSMKKKWTKGAYIQDRAHVFLNHFGVDTFTYSIEDVEKRKSWKMENDRKAFPVVYEMTVIQTYKGKYGNFDLVQKVYAVREKGKWKVVWDYKQ